MKQHGPWKIKSSEVKYKNPWMEVREDQVIRPDGKDGIYGTISVLSGSSVLPIDEEGNVYLSQEFHYGVGQETIEVVAGGLDKDESPLDCAKRELEEEAGISATDFVDLGRIVSYTSYMDASVYLYLARNLSFKEVSRQEALNIKLIKISLEKALMMVMNGEIFHTGSCVLILKAAKYLGKL